VKVKTYSLEQKLSFLYTVGAASVYSLKSPSEWFAESYASCVFKMIYPASKKITRSVEVEHLLGFYPMATTAKFCRQFSFKPNTTKKK